jgi:16S rRNA (cytidine1402-2'-O)-methyltransferase
MSGTLYIVATPIGNLGDVTVRAQEVLRSVDAVFCEDTRVTAKLMAAFGITKPLFAYHQHSGEKTIADIARSLGEGLSLALVSDAGTPGINDPGGKLVAELLQRVPGLHIVPIPGANAAVTALSVCGLPADSYRYLGFVPQKKGRKGYFSAIAEGEETAVFYESKHRILKSLDQLATALEGIGTPERPVVVARELTGSSRFTAALPVRSSHL